MIRSLFAGVSGLRNHQAFMDVISNNIANINTIGFKSGRITFKESLALLLKGAQSATSSTGGINPMQIGLGMTIGSIDQIFSQGNLEATGQETDLAIQGDGLFIVNDGARRYYTRAGNFQLDALGRLVSPSTGFVLQGKMANAKGEIAEGSAVGNITLPFGKKTPAKATSMIGFAGNLDAGGVSNGTIFNSGKVYGIELDGKIDVNNLYADGNADAIITGMTSNSTQVTVNDGTTSKTYTYVEGAATIGSEFHTLEDLIAGINADFTTLAADIVGTGDGSILITADAGNAAAIDLAITSTNSNFGKALSSANSSLAAGATSSTDQFSHIAVEDDLLVNLRNKTGGSLQLVNGDTINADVFVGADDLTSVSIGAGTIAVTLTKTYAEMAEDIETIFKLKNNTGIVIDESTGGLTINGDGGLVNRLSQLVLTADNGAGTSRAGFDGLFDATTGNWFEQQEATDYTQSASITVFDSKGESHVVTMQYIKDPVEDNKWRWESSVDGVESSLMSGKAGEITFDSTGNLKTFTYDDGSAEFKFMPPNGANRVEIDFSAGTFGQIDGLSQFDGSPNAIANVQDGYTVGELSHITVDSTGVISGVYTNGVAQDLARVVLATFNNPTGLVRIGDNLYDVSGNSGQAVVGDAGTTIQSTITSGALELSNVELVEEFTKMIIAQRGFQANARVTTVSDKILEEVVRLKQ